ncbi:MAG: uroporphyrinogen decarboxylase family protein [Clostridium sp.]
MTPRERMEAFSKGEEIDRIPCMPSMGVTMANLMGVSNYEYYHSADKIADLEVFLFEKIGHDSVGVGTTLRGVAEALGSKIAYPTNGISYLEEPILKDIREVENLSPADPLKDGKLPLAFEALGKVIKRIGHLVEVGSDIAGPLSAAAAVVGTENLMKGMIKYPDKVHTLLEIVTETNLRIIRQFASMGVGLGMSDPISSTSMISLARYKEFSMPYQKKCVDKMREITGQGTSIHICGKSSKLWEDILKTGVTSFSIDNVEDLKEAKLVLGKEVCIAGNVDPVNIMRNGSVQDVLEASKKCIMEAYDSPNGFVLSTGCQIPMGTPIENIQAMMEAARIYGKYPIKY